MEEKNIIHSCAAKLSKNGYEVTITPSVTTANIVIHQQIEELSPGSISFGDSMTLFATGIIDWLRNQHEITFIDTFENGVRYKELITRRRQALTCDLFFTGINAISMDGTLHWLDMIGNRIAPVMFGPRKVILIAGKNKIVATKEEAFQRIRKIAAPQNAARHAGELNTPCIKTGMCMDCSSPTRICNAQLTLHKCYPKSRIHIILIDQDLGL